MNPSEAELHVPVCHGYSSKTAAYCIREAASLRGVGIEALAQAVAIPPSYMESLFEGREYVGEEFLERVAVALDYTPGEILSLMYLVRPSRNF
jgi:hypothetical protein